MLLLDLKYQEAVVSVNGAKMIIRLRDITDISLVKLLMFYFLILD